jgi:hypothetical protein
MSLPDFPDLHEASDDITAELIRAVDGSCTAAHAMLKLLFADVRRLEERVAGLKAQARPPIQAVAFHTRIPGRGRGRPRGTQNRNKHVYVNGHDPAP